MTLLSLREISLKANVPHSLYDLTLKAITCLVQKEIQNILDKLKCVEYTEKDFVYNEIYSLADALFNNMPSLLANDVQKVVLKEIKTLIDDFKSGYLEDVHDIKIQFPNNVNYIPFISLVLMHPRVKRLNFGWFPIESHSYVYQALKSLVSVEILQCNKITYPVDNILPSSVYHSLKYLHYLKRVFIQHYCTDNIIIRLIKRCPYLYELDAANSPNVTDACLPAIKSCPSIRIINFPGTAITAVALVPLQLPPENFCITLDDKYLNYMELVRRKNRFADEIQYNDPFIKKFYLFHLR